MKNLNIYIVAVMAIALWAMSSYSSSLLKKLQAKTNTVYALTDSLHSYKIHDSLNCAQKRSAELSLSDYKRVCSEQYQLIQKLKCDRPTGVHEIEILKHDTVTAHIVDTIVLNDTCKSFKWSDNWTTVSGLICNDSVSLAINSVEDVIVVESITRKKFFGIKLPIKTFGYKNRQVSVVSRNPHTYIKNIESVVLQ